MRNLIEGVLRFEREALPQYAEKFAALAAGQDPKVMLITCVDSRVVPNLISAADPGELFVMRNVGNLLPTLGSSGLSATDPGAPAAVFFATRGLGVEDVVVCGHSGCGAMQQHLERTRTSPSASLGNPNLDAWLDQLDDALHDLRTEGPIDDDLPECDQLAQINVVRQIRRLQSYPFVREKLKVGALRLHGWYFDISTARVMEYAPNRRRFLPLAEGPVARSILAEA